VVLAEIRQLVEEEEKGTPEWMKKKRRKR